MDQDFFFGWGVFGVFLIVLGIAFHFLPTFVALARDAPDKIWIFLLNFFLGWTFFGWITALIWACTSKRPDPVIINDQPAPAAATPKTPTAEVPYSEKLENLRKLKELLDAGVLSQEEFEIQKGKILQS